MENITIPLEEYKQLLEIKGKYEELKEQQQLPTTIYSNLREDKLGLTD